MTHSSLAHSRYHRRQRPHSPLPSSRRITRSRNSSAAIPLGLYPLLVPSGFAPHSLSSSTLSAHARCLSFRSSLLDQIRASIRLSLSAFHSPNQKLCQHLISSAQPAPSRSRGHSDGSPPTLALRHLLALDLAQLLCASVSQSKTATRTRGLRPYSSGLDERHVTPAFSWLHSTPRNRFPPLRSRLRQSIRPLRVHRSHFLRFRTHALGTAARTARNILSPILTLAGCSSRSLRIRNRVFALSPLHLTVLPLNVDGLATALTFRS